LLNDNARQSYARIPVDLWRNPHFKRLEAVDQWTFFLLLGQPDITRIGHVHAKWKVWGQCASDATPEGVMRSVAALDDAGWVAFDEETDEIWVRPYMAMQQTWDQPWLAIAAARDYRLIFSQWLRELVLDAVPEPARDGWPDNLLGTTQRNVKKLLTTGEMGPTKAKRRPVPPNLRAQVYARDGLRCVTCGTDERLTIDHIVAVVNGGTNDPENLQTMCKPCNSRKGDR
jgi:hypothetical protein